MPAPDNSDQSQPVDDPNRPDRGAIALHDAWLSGWYHKDTGELYPGFPIDPEDIVVDVGCGDGGNLNFCAIRGATLIGVDLDPNAVSAAATRLGEDGQRRTQLHTAAAEQVPVDTGLATRVICAELLEHVADPQVVMAELVRVGQPGALYLITVPDEVGETVQLHRASAEYFQPPNHIRIFSREQFNELVADSGLEILATSLYGFFWNIWWALFWETGTELSNPDHPTLHEWTKLWRDLLQTESGRQLRDKLDKVAPKTQVIVARKPLS